MRALASRLGLYSAAKAQFPSSDRRPPCPSPAHGQEVPNPRTHLWVTISSAGGCHSESYEIRRPKRLHTSLIRVACSYLFLDDAYLSQYGTSPKCSNR